MLIAVRDDGGIDIKGDEQELLELIATVQEAIREGEADGAMLNDECVIPVVVSCEDA